MIVSSFSQMYDFEVLGPMIKDFDAIFEYELLPKDESSLMKLYEEIMDLDMTVEQLLQSDLPLLSDVAREIRVANQSLPRDAELNMVVMISIVFEIELVFPGIGKVIERYSGPEEQPVVSRIVNEVYQLLEQHTE